MRSARFLMMVAVGMAVTMAFSGCSLFRKKNATGAGTADGNVLGVTPSAISDDTLGMSGERFGGTEQRGMFQAVYFDYDSSTVKPSERSKIEEVASKLGTMQGASVVVEGHCDERGSAEYNLALGERRALAVRAYLVGLGVAAERVQTKSFGEENPVAMGHGEDSWRLNRRGEFVLVQ